MVHRAEVAEGLQGAGMTGAGGGIDKKSVNRLMNLCDATKQARNVQMTLSTFTGEPRQVGEGEVLVLVLLLVLVLACSSCLLVL